MEQMLKPCLFRVVVALVAAVALPLAACSSDGGPSGSVSETGSAIGTLEVHDASVSVPPNPSQAAVRFVVDNGTDVDDELVAVSSPVADRAEVHKSDVDAEGRSTMEAVPSLDIPAGASVAFEAGGLHVMLTGLAEELKEGDTFPMTLTFEEAGDVAVTVDVVAPATTPKWRITTMVEPRPPWSRRRFLGSAGAGAAVLALGACGLNRGASVDRSGQPESGSFGGTLVEDPPFDKPDRTFVDHNNEPFNLRTDTKDRLAVLFFGYTNCPDVCPVYLNQMSSAIKAIGSGPGSRPLVLFVGVDTARDTPAVLKDYLSDFGDQFVGLTADDETVAAALDDLTLPQVILREPDENGDYYVDHAAYAVAFSPDNLGHRIYATGDVRQQDWVKDLPRLDEGTYV